MSNLDGLQTDADGRMDFGNDPYYWGAVLAYKNGLTNKDDKGWFIDRISPDAEIDQYSAVQTRGSIGEYAITFGMNFVDKFYIGASLGIQSINYRRTTFYGENYIYADGLYPSGEEMPYQLDYMNYSQATELSGTGVNFKIGATYRPFKFLRLGIAYHTPTAYSVAFGYEAEMCASSIFNNVQGYDNNQKSLINPVAMGTLAWKKEKSYNIVPQISLDYKLLGLSHDETQLRYRGSVTMNAHTLSNSSFRPSSLTTLGMLNENYNLSDVKDDKSLEFNTRHRLQFSPRFSNPDHVTQFVAQFEMNSKTGNSQWSSSNGIPSGIDFITSCIE